MAIITLAISVAMATASMASGPGLDSAPNLRRDLGGRFFIPERPVGTILTVDCMTGDWPGSALSVAVTGPVTGTIKMMVVHPDNPLADDTLYLLAAINDNTSNTGASPDRIVFMFDLYHDHAVPSAGSWISADNRGIRVTRSNTVTRVYNNVLSPTPDENVAAFESSRKCVAGAGAMDSVWTVEAAIVPSDLGLNAFNGLMGMAVAASDLNTGFAVTGVWPAGATNTTSTWANVLTRQPIDYILLIDQSGSMWGDKWTSAKQAGDNFALVLSKTKDTELDPEFAATPAVNSLGDRLGLANFSSSLPSWGTQVVGLTLIPANPGSFTAGLPANPGGGTPIAGGLNRTSAMFGGAPTFGGFPRTRVVMLLSDGMHNTPNSSIDFTTPNPGHDLDYLPSPCGTNSLVRVNTVAVGTDATVDVTKLNAIKDCYAGLRFTTSNTYNYTDPAEGQLTAQLTKFFVQVIEPYYQWNVVNETGANFTINAGDRRLLLFAFWANRTDAANLTVTKPDLSVATGSSDTNLGYSWLVIDDPPAGDYTNFTAPNGPTGRLVLVDLRIRGDFAINNEPHGTGSSLLLRARLRDAGQPVTGADVRVDIARPGEGFGTYTSTHTLNRCTPGAPSLPREPTLQDRVGGITGAAGGGQPDSTGDVKPPAFALIAALFQRCGKTSLARLADPGQQLFDDGTHGDLVAGDGIYTLAMNNTQYEGSYVFRFRATGHTADGKSFARSHETATYVGIKVDPSASTIGSRTLQVVGSQISQEYFVIPRDHRGEYLGPGHSARVKFTTSGGATPVGVVIDYNNGIYSQVVRYDRTQGRPIVTPVVDGTPIRAAIPTRPWELVLPFAGITAFDNALPLKNGAVVGTRLGYRLSNQLTIEAEGGVTFAKDTGGGSGHVFQALGNLRWDVKPLQVGNWTPHVTVGAGYALFRGFTTDDQAFLYQAGVGSTLQVKSSFGLRVDARALRIADVLGAGATTNYQATVGLVWWF